MKKSKNSLKMIIVHDKIQMNMKIILNILTNE